MFRADEEKEKEFSEASKAQKTPPNYRISKNDFIEFQIFTNKGEIIIDPTSEFAKQASNATSATNRVKYLVQADGCADLPILGHTKLDSLTLHQCDSMLAEKYGKFYLDVFVVSAVTNRRIFLMHQGFGFISGGGAGGGRTSQIIPLESENVTLFEILSKAGGVGQFSHINRVKVIRGDLKNPTIFTIDLTKWDSFQSSNLVMQPNDIVYIEPLRRSGFEFLRDASQIFGIASALLSIYLLSRL
jgi:polysaccharide export outer membrane protein